MFAVPSDLLQGWGLWGGGAGKEGGKGVNKLYKRHEE